MSRPLPGATVEDMTTVGRPRTMRRPWRRRTLTILLVVVASVGPGIGVAQSASDAASAPLRSGTIIGGPDTMGSAPCGVAPDCAAWLQSGCSPALAGRDPALFTSIVDVADLADGTTPRLFEFSKTVLWSGVLLQFWDGSCRQVGDCLGVDTDPADDNWWLGLYAPLGCRSAEIEEARDSYNYDWEHGTAGLLGSSFTTLEIPRGARWMTVGGSAAVYVTWSLTNAPPRPVAFDPLAASREQCQQFPTWNEAQVHFETDLAARRGDDHGLDPDGDGVPCDELPDAPTYLARPASEGGYLMAEANGTVFGFGDAAPVRPVVTEPTVGIALGPDGGYWVLTASGHVRARGVFHHGDATALPANDRVTAIAGVPDGSGYWIFTEQGRVLPFGSARSLGDMSGVPLTASVTAAAATPSGNGYWMVGTDGGIFSFGDAQFAGSTGAQRLNEPVVGIAPDSDGRGYWLIAEDGGVFAFDAPFRGSVPGVLAPGQRLNRPVIGAIAHGDGYLMVASDGGIFSFSDRPFHGSLGSTPPPNPIVGVVAR